LIVLVIWTLGFWICLGLVLRGRFARYSNFGFKGFMMGRTVLPFSRVLEQEVQEWRKFRRGLRKEDQQFLDRLFEEARLHVQAGVYASRPWPFETILISILLEHEKALVELRSKLKAIEEKEGDPSREDRCT
jgi:hypothetical protein